MDEEVMSDSQMRKALILRWGESARLRTWLSELDSVQLKTLITFTVLLATRPMFQSRVQ